MSNYYCTIRIRATGDIKSATALDDHFGKHQYGYRVDGEDYVYSSDEVDEMAD